MWTRATRPQRLRASTTSTIHHQPQEAGSRSVASSVIVETMDVHIAMRESHGSAAASLTNKARRVKDTALARPASFLRVRTWYHRHPDICTLA
nr:hypothetical protein CFP56_62137 [Quercus suber]